MKSYGKLNFAESFCTFAQVIEQKQNASLLSALINLKKVISTSFSFSLVSLDLKENVFCSRGASASISQMVERAFDFFKLLGIFRQI